MSLTTYCSVDGCNNRRKNSNLSFFKLPTQPEKLKTWLQLIGRSDLIKRSNLKPRSHLICSIHFDESMIKTIKLLRPGAVPTKFLPSYSPPRTLSSEINMADKSTQSVESCINIELVHKNINAHSKPTQSQLEQSDLETSSVIEIQSDDDYDELTQSEDIYASILSVDKIKKPGTQQVQSPSEQSDLAMSSEIVILSEDESTQSEDSYVSILSVDKMKNADIGPALFQSEQSDLEISSKIIMQSEDESIQSEDSYVNSVDAGRFPANSQSIQFGPWYIAYDVSCILPSMCSTKVVCERDDDQFCQFCLYCKELSLPHFPDMVFPKNILTLTHSSGAKISFDPLDALKLVGHTVDAIEVSCAEAWQESRPDAEKQKKTFDWTFSTTYKGTLSKDIVVENTDEKINIELLKQKDQILFYHDLTLFEDELHDHGISKLSVKIRVMPSYWYVLLRYFLRVDDVLVRSSETRLFHLANTDYVLSEYTYKEAQAKDLNIPTSQMKEADDVIPLLPVIHKTTEKLIVNVKNN